MDINEVDELINDLAGLFGEVEDIIGIDAADFVDNAEYIWDLRQRARKIKLNNQI